jgi:hypothetical protein
MGTVTNTAQFTEASELPAVSRGGKRRRIFVGTISMSSSYATGGDTVAGLPTDAGTLKGLFLSPTIAGGWHLTWDGSTATPKIKAHDLADGTVGNIGAEPAATTNLSAITGIGVLAVYEKG